MRVLHVYSKADNTRVIIGLSKTYFTRTAFVKVDKTRVKKITATCVSQEY